MRPQIVAILIFALIVLYSAPMLAQPSGSDTGPPPPELRTPPDLPIDNGLFILIIAGVLYGSYISIKKTRAKNSRA